MAIAAHSETWDTTGAGKGHPV